MYIFFLLFAAEKNDDNYEQLFLYFGLYINFLFRFLPSVFSLDNKEKLILTLLWSFVFHIIINYISYQSMKKNISRYYYFVR